MARRVASIWFPRFAAERLIRRMGGVGAPFAVIAEEKGGLRALSLSAEAEAAGLARGMALADARALAPDLVTRAAAPEADAAFLATLSRWAMRYSPWVGLDGADGLTLDISGCAHLFGGEAAMLADMTGRLEASGLSARAAAADTRGAAWALARFAAGDGAIGPAGDAISEDARATRVRAPARKSWEKPRPPAPPRHPIAPEGGARAALSPLPVAALRLDAAVVESMTRLGLRQIGDLAGAPRGTLARRFGVEAVRRLDQALGAEPEPISAIGPRPIFAARLSLPDPVARIEDVAAGLERLLKRVTEKLSEQAMGARRLRLSLRRVDHADLHVEVGLARPSRDRAVVMELFERPLAELDAGFGIEAMRLEAVEREPLAALQHTGHAAARAEAAARAAPGGGEAFATVLGRIGGRVGFERLERYLPADSHIPAKAFTVASAAFSEPPAAWPHPAAQRPVTLFPPEPIDPEPGRPPRAFRWRGRDWRVARAFGPERIAPEWWLDDPDWRTGPRDYWRVETAEGRRLWLFHTPASDRIAQWFAEGEFA